MSTPRKGSPAAPPGAPEPSAPSDPAPAPTLEEAAPPPAAEVPVGEAADAGPAVTGGGTPAGAGKPGMTAGPRSDKAVTPTAAKTTKASGGAPGAGGARARGGKGADGKGAGGKGAGRRPVPPPPGPGLVVGPVPVLARVAGAVALVAAALLLLAPAFPLARSGGRDLGGPGNLFGFVPALPLVAVVAAAGVLAVRGALPRLALAALLPAGTLATGLLLRTLALFDTGTRSTLDLPLGIGTSARYQVAGGLVVAALGYGTLLLAAVLAALAWPRTLMEDDGDLDPRRPRLAAWGLAAGVLAALVLGMAPYTSSIAPGTPTLPERSGLDLLGGLVLALGAMVWAVISATLRPRLAAVGAYAGLAAALLSESLAGWLLVARSPAIGASAGGVGAILAAVAAAVLAWVALGRKGLRRTAT